VDKQISVYTFLTLAAYALLSALVLSGDLKGRRCKILGFVPVIMWPGFVELFPWFQCYGKKIVASSLISVEC